MKELIPVEIIESKIYLFRGHKVMLDRELAELYMVPTRVLLQAVKRNIQCFPEDFMFQLDNDEFRAWGKKISALCLYRAGCSHAFQCAQQRKSGPGEHCHYADIREAATDAFFQCRNGP